MLPNGDGTEDEDGREPSVSEPGSVVPDPRDLLPDPEADPEDETEAEEDETTPVSEVPGSARLSFWWLVIVCNGVVLALFLGVMYGVFENNWDLGGRLLLAGGILAVYALYKYRTFPREEIKGVASDDADTDGEPPEESREDPDGEVVPGAGDGESVPEPAEVEALSGPDKESIPESGDEESIPDPAGDPAPEEPLRAPAGTVEDGDGDRYLLVKESGESSLVRDPATGRQRYLPNDRIERVEEPALSAAAGSVPEGTRRVLSAVHDERSLGLLVEVVDRGPVGVRSLLSEYDLCESDLHGLLAEFRAAGLLRETSVAGERGYEATEVAVEGVDHLRATGRE